MQLQFIIRTFSKSMWAGRLFFIIVRVIKLENWSKMHGHNEIRGGSVCNDADFA